MGDRGSPPEGRRPLQWVRWLVSTDHGAVTVVREVAAGVVLVALVGLLLAGISGVWPPMVAVESESMAPNMQPGDLVFVMDEDRLVPPSARDGTGIVTHRVGRERGYTTFGAPGDVIVYRPDGSDRRTPVIHRAQFWANSSENWYGKADPDYVSGDSCEAVPNCPAPHAGFVTKGDGNDAYDQVAGVSGPVRPSWIRGTAEVRVPYLGYVRLAAS